MFATTFYGVNQGIKQNVFVVCSLVSLVGTVNKQPENPMLIILWFAINMWYYAGIDITLKFQIILTMKQSTGLKWVYCRTLNAEVSDLTRYGKLKNENIGQMDI